MMAAARQREFVFTQKDFDFLRRLSNSHTGIVVSDDKFDMFYSRLARRVRALGLPDFASGSSPNQVGNIHRQIPSGYRSSPPRWK